MIRCAAPLERLLGYEPMPPAALKQSPTMTADAFMDWVDTGPPGKKVLIDGVIVAMAPTSPTHGTIQARMAVMVGNHLVSRNSPCRVATEAAVQPRIRNKTNVRIPDLIVTCEPVPTKTQKFHPDPALIIEVLSPGNSDDTAGSLLACATIPSVMEMLVVDSARAFAELWRRDASGAWPKDPDSVSPGGTVTLTTIDMTFKLTDAYVGTYLAMD
jgi:Uma2 family endonuclease